MEIEDFVVVVIVVNMEDKRTNSDVIFRFGVSALNRCG